MKGVLILEQKYSVKLSTIAEEHELHIEYASSDFAEKIITSADLNRPGMQLLGHLEYFDTDRIQIIGKAEIAMMRQMTAEQREGAYEIIMSHHVPAVIVAHEQPAYPDLLAMARKYDVSVMTTDMPTSEFYAQLIGTLRRYLAPRQTVHGVLVEVYGEGMLITGDSGIGKSETALELIKRGHRLIADDAVEIRRTSRSTLEGRSPEIIRYFMELRGIGVINVLNVYGVGAVKKTTPIDMEVSLELWESGKAYDRLGLESEHSQYLGVTVPKVVIPVRPGRNLAVILELAAMTNRQKKFGYNAAEELARRIDEQVDSGIAY